MKRQNKEQFKRFLPSFLFEGYHMIRKLKINLQFFFYRNFLKGGKLQCIICEERYKKFLPDGEKVSVLQELDVIGAKRRENCICPNCRSKDRDRLIYLFLKQETGIFRENKKLLHIAPETSLKRIFQNRHNIDYINGDLNPDHADVSIDITNIQYPDNHFDAVICNHVLEHIPDDHLAMSEIHRVLKPHGWAILQVPIGKKLNQTIEDRTITDPAEMEIRFGQFDHVRIYGPDYADRLIKAGFDVKIIDPASYFTVELIQQNSFAPGEKIYFASKGGIE